MCSLETWYTKYSKVLQSQLWQRHNHENPVGECFTFFIFMVLKMTYLLCVAYPPLKRHAGEDSVLSKCFKSNSTPFVEPKKSCTQIQIIFMLYSFKDSLFTLAGLKCHTSHIISFECQIVLHNPLRGFVTRLWYFIQRPLCLAESGPDKAAAGPFWARVFITCSKNCKRCFDWFIYLNKDGVSLEA